MNLDFTAVRIRRMTIADLERVTEIAENLKEAPQWPRAAFERALDPAAQPKRIALVAEAIAKTEGKCPEVHPSGAKEAAEKLGISFETSWKCSSGAEAHVNFAGFMRGLKPPPPSEMSSSAACKAHVDSSGFMRGLKPPPPSGSSSSAGFTVGEGRSSAPREEIHAAGEEGCEAREGGEVVGFAVASLLPPEAELETIAVASSSQRHGLARRLFAELVTELGAARITEVYLEVRPSNQPALGLYLRLGFAETGRRSRYYHDPVEDAAMMRLNIEGFTATAAHRSAL